MQQIQQIQLNQIKCKYCEKMFESEYKLNLCDDCLRSFKGCAKQVRKIE